MGQCCDNEGRKPDPVHRNDDLYNVETDERKWLYTLLFQDWLTDLKLIVEDLPIPSTMGISDRYRLFELNTPFARIRTNTFMTLLKKADSDCGDKGFVTLESLRSHLITDAWKDLDNEESSISKFLLSSTFKKEGGSDG